MIFVTLPIMFEKIINILIMNKIITANFDSSYLDFWYDWNVYPYRGSNNN